MIGYSDVMKALKPHLRAGQCFSFPVPILENGALLDAVFVFTVNRSTKLPNEPIGTLKVNIEDGSVAFDADAFADIGFAPSEFFMPEGYMSLRNEARELYAHVRYEVSNAAMAGESARYAQIVWALSQDCLKPCYRKLSSALFGDFG